MDETHKELVKRLRQPYFGAAPANNERSDAADALEAMAGEVERVTKERDDLDANGIHTCHDKCTKHFCVMRRRMQAAESERDRLKAALQDCVDAYDFVIVDEYDRGWSSVSDAIHAARKALGGDA